MLDVLHKIRHRGCHDRGSDDYHQLSGVKIGELRPDAILDDENARGGLALRPSPLLQLLSHALEANHPGPGKNGRTPSSANRHFNRSLIGRRVQLRPPLGQSA
jgi:hypothetical protein